VRAPGAAIEVGGDATTRACVFEETEILERNPQEHGHFIERNAASCFVEHATRDLDRFAALPGSGEQTDVAVPFAFGWAIEGKHMPSKGRQIGSLAFIQSFDRSAQFGESPNGELVTIRAGRQHVW
jgi:hypothetical protein